MLSSPNINHQQGGILSTRIQMRKQLVAALPPSPFKLIACPSMILFIGAFYLLHLGYMLATQTQLFTLYRVACAEILVFNWNIIILACLMSLIHIGLVIPNLLRNLLTRSKDTTQMAPDRTTLWGRLSTRLLANRRRTVAIYSSYYVVQRVAWVISLMEHLILNWNAFILINHQLDELKVATSETLSLDPLTPLNPSSTPICGVFGSIHLIRWSLLCIVITTAICVSFLLFWLQESWYQVYGIYSILLGRKKRSHTTASTFNSSPASSTSNAATSSNPFLDLQTDELVDADDENEEPFLSTL